MSDAGIKRRFSWGGVFGALVLGLVVCLPLYIALRGTGMPIVASGSIAIVVGPILVGLLLNHLLARSPLLEACLGLGTGAFAWGTYQSGNLLGGLMTSAMVTAIGGLGIWIGFSIRDASRPTGMSGACRCISCESVLLATREAGTDYCPRCDLYS